MRLHLGIRFGTHRFPEKTARRLRALNIAAWCAAVLSAGFAAVQFLDAAPGAWKPALANLVAAPMYAAIPLLHRYGPLAAPVAFAAIAYGFIFVLVWLLGTGTGMQFYYLTAVALVILFLGVERIRLATGLGAVGAALIVVLEILVPYNTGLQSAGKQLASFIVTVAANCAFLITIVFYALREAARAETTAEREHQRSEALLANILPFSVAERLKSAPGQVIADKYDEASILFADLADYTARASNTSPDDLVAFLNRTFSDFDRLVERHGLEKIKTTGDAYMVVSGVPVPRPDHAQALARLALDMREAAADLRDPHGGAVAMRIGIGSGPVVAGIVGTRKFFYDVWGDAVNVASHMESAGVPGRIQVSLAAYERLKDEFKLEPRGEIDAKGKGRRIRTWFLVGRAVHQDSVHVTILFPDNAPDEAAGPPSPPPIGFPFSTPTAAWSMTRRDDL